MRYRTATRLLALTVLAACGAAGDDRLEVPASLTAAGSGSVQLPTNAPPAQQAVETTQVPVAAPAAPPSTATQPAQRKPSGIVPDTETGELVFRTEPVELKPFEEAYTCFAVTVPEDMVIDGFKKGGQVFVHHAQFVKSLLPEPEGISTCNQQFKITWLPIFLAGAGPSELQFDEGVGHIIYAGEQLTLQMHLYNASDKPVSDVVEIRMHKSRSPNVTPVTPWAIGSSEINLMPRQSGKAQNVCTQTDAVEVLAVFPHMHQLGSKLTIEVGNSLHAMQPLYARDPFNFDDQRMEKMKLKLSAGDMLRVTCEFKENPHDTPVTFGESSSDEMCFFVGFALGAAPAQADCGNLWDALLTL